MFPPRCWWKGLIVISYIVHFMLGLGKEAKIWYNIKYLMFTHILILWIKGSQFFRNIICDVINHSSFGSWWRSLDESLKLIVYILNNIIIFLLRCIYDIRCVILSFVILWFFFISLFFIHHGFLQEFIKDLILFLAYPVFVYHFI